jgi:hypothetical protein
MKTLADIQRVQAVLPPRILIHGREGTGKTTLGTRFPHPVFMQTEDGIGGGLEVDSFGLLQDFTSVLDAISALSTGEHPFRTVVLDSLDALEPMVWRAICFARNWQSIEAPGYGRGYVEADKLWAELLAGLDWLRRTRNMTIVLIAHSAVETVNDPRAPAYTSYQLRLHKRARALVQDWADALGFLSTDVVVHSEDTGFGRKRARADGGAHRYLHFEGRPAYTAKNRFALPARLLVPPDFDFAKLAPFFPAAVRENPELIKHAANKQEA